MLKKSEQIHEKHGRMAAGNTKQADTRYGKTGDMQLASRERDIRPVNARRSDWRGIKEK